MESNGCSIQDQILEVTVVSGNGLKDTQWYWFSKQDPYVVVQYAGSQYRTRTCKDGGKNPVFHPNKFQFKLIEGIRELRVTALNSNIIATNNLIGKAKVYLEDVLSSGYQDCSYLLTNNNKYAGEIRLILRYLNAHKPEATFVPPPPTSAKFQPPQCPLPPFYQTSAPYTPFPAHQPQHAPHQQLTYLPHTVYPPTPNVYPPPARPVYPPPGPSPYFTPPSPYHGSYPPSY